MKQLLCLLLLLQILQCYSQDVILSNEGEANSDDNGVLDNQYTTQQAKTPKFVLLCALIPQIPGCPCDSLIDTRETYYDFKGSDCVCYDSQQSGFDSPPCFCANKNSPECQCLSGLTS